MTLEQEQQFLYLTTKGWKSRTQHEVEIWFVSYDDKYYLIPERKERAHWIQNIMHNPTVLFTVHSKSFEGTARTVDKLTEHKLSGHSWSYAYKVWVERGINCRVDSDKEQVE